MKRAMQGEAAQITLMTEKLLPDGASDERATALSHLVERAKAGDATAFDQIMVHCQRKIMGLTWRLLGNEEDARDAAQETFLRAYRHLKSFKTDRDFNAWLYRIAVNVCHDLARKRAVRHQQFASIESEREYGTLDVLASADNAEELMMLKQKRALIAAALSALPPKERAAIVLRDLEGLSTEEVAEITGTRPATVRVQISSARAKIKKHCERRLKKEKQS